MAEAILPVLLAIVAAAPGILALLKGRNKEKADIVKTLTESAGELVKEYRAKVDEIKKEYLVKIEEIEATVAEQANRIRVQQEELDGQAKRIRALETERVEIMNGVQSLCVQIRKAGHEPVWEPKPAK